MALEDDSCPTRAHTKRRNTSIYDSYKKTCAPRRRVGSQQSRFCILSLKRANRRTTLCDGPGEAKRYQNQDALPASGSLWSGLIEQHDNHTKHTCKRRQNHLSKTEPETGRTETRRTMFMGREELRSVWNGCAQLLHLPNAAAFSPPKTTLRP